MSFFFCDEKYIRCKCGMCLPTCTMYNVHLYIFRIYKYKDTVSLWTLLDDNARNKSIKLPESSAVLQILNTWMQNKNYPLVRLEVDGDDLVLKQVNDFRPGSGKTLMAETLSVR